MIFTDGFQVDPFQEHRRQTIAEREDEYRARRRQMIISPPRHDPFANGMSYSSPFFIIINGSYIIFIITGSGNLVAVTGKHGILIN